MYSGSGVVLVVILKTTGELGTTHGEPQPPEHGGWGSIYI